MRRSAAAVGLAASLFFPSCRPSPRADLSWCAPPAARAVAFVRLDPVRTPPALSPLVELLAPAFRSGASSLLLAWDGREILVAGEGRFPQPPPGAVMASPGIALTGAPAVTAAALAQFRTGRPGVPDLVASVGALPAGLDIRAAVRGDAALPLSGNLANLNRLLGMSETVAIGLKIEGAVEIAARASCRSAEDAASLEQTVRAMLLLAGAGRPPGPRSGGWADSVRISRDGHTLALSLSLPASEAAGLLEGWRPR